jgi:flavin-dependent dehydrogenase
VGGADNPDVVVVGGGPGASATAIGCARSGLSVTLAHRGQPAHDRPGEALLPGTEPLLRALGVGDRFAAADFPRHAGHWSQWEGERRFARYGEDADGPWLGCQARRHTLDSLLLDGAAAVSVDVRVVPVIEPVLDRGRIAGVRLAGGTELPARIVVDATGGAHWLARRLGVAIVDASPRLLAFYGYLSGELPGDDGCPSIVADQGGWTWLARVKPAVHQWVRLALDGSRPPAGWRPPQFQGLSERQPARGADVSWRWVPACAGAGYFMVGDACAVLDPLSAQGVLRALMTGMLAGQLIVGICRGSLPEPVAVAYYRDHQRRSFAHGVGALRSLYAAMPRPPDWITDSAIVTMREASYGSHGRRAR